MKLINKTRLSDKVLENILRDAAKALNKRVRTTGVVVKVVYNKKSTYTNGWALKCDTIKWGKKDKRIKTDKGVIHISVPCLYDELKDEYTKQATGFFETMRHEWGHVSDFQSKKKLAFDQGLNGRRRNHGNRLEERRVHQYIEAAEKRGHTTDKYMNVISQFAEEVIKKYSKNMYL